MCCICVDGYIYIMIYMCRSNCSIWTQMMPCSAWHGKTHGNHGNIDYKLLIHIYIDNYIYIYIYYLYSILYVYIYIYRSKYHVCIHCMLYTSLQRPCWRSTLTLTKVATLHDSTCSMKWPPGWWKWDLWTAVCMRQTRLTSQGDVNVKPDTS